MFLTVVVWYIFRPEPNNYHFYAFRVPQDEMQSLVERKVCKVFVRSSSDRMKTL